MEESIGVRIPARQSNRASRNDVINMQTENKINKIEIIKWPRKNSYATLVVAVISVVVAIGSLLLSWHTYKKFLPLQSANLFISWSETAIFPNPGYDVIEPVLKNVGGADAEKISLKVYIVTLNNKYDFGWSTKLYDEVIPGK